MGTGHSQTKCLKNEKKKRRKWTQLWIRFDQMDPAHLPDGDSVYGDAFWGAMAALFGTLFAANVYVVIRSLRVSAGSYSGSSSTLGPFPSTYSRAR